MKKFLKKGALSVALCFVLAGGLFCAACDSEKNYGYTEVVGEYGTAFDLYTLPDLGELRFYDLSVTSPSGEVVTLSSELLYLSEEGTWTVDAASAGWKIRAEDTMQPIVIVRGSLDGYFAGETVELPEILVRDNHGAAVTDFSTAVYYGEEKVSDGEVFVAEKEGTYTLAVTAADGAGNTANYKQEFSVRRLADSVVAAGETIALDKSFFGEKLSADTAYTFSFTVRKNGTAVEAEGSSITAEAKSLYEIEGTAAAGQEKVSAYAVYVTDDLYAETLNRYTDVYDYGMTATSGTVSLVRANDNAEVKVVPAAREVPLSIPVVSGSAAALDGKKVTVSFDLRVEGYEDYDFGTDPNKYTTIVGTGRCEGETYRVRGSVTGVVTNGKIDTTAYVRVIGNPFYLDNFTYTCEDALTATAESEVVNAEVGADVTLGADLFGVKFTDFMGTEVEASIQSVSKTEPGGTTTELSPPYTVDTSAECFYDVTFTAEKDGVSGTKTVKLAVGDVDVYAPELSFTGGKTVNQTVEAGTEITVSAEGLGIGISDESETEESIAVKKNGAAHTVEGGSVTVESGSYYEFTVMVTDSFGNASMQYVLVRAADCYLVTFDTFALGQAPSSNYVCNQTDNGAATNNSRTVVDLGGGNYAFRFTPGSTQLNLNWVAEGIPAGTYDIRINFRFDAGTLRRVFLTDASYNSVTNGQDINTAGATEGSITISAYEVAASTLRYAFRLFCNVSGNVYVESVQFIPAGATE